MTTLRRRTSFALLVVLSVFSLAGLPRLRFAYDIERFFPQDDPAVAEYTAHKMRFGDEMRVLLVGMELPNGVDQQALEQLAATTKSLKALPMISAVNSLSTIGEASRLPLGEWITVPYFQPPFDTPAHGLQRLGQREEVAAMFLAANGRSTTLIVELTELPDAVARAETLKAIRHTLDHSGSPYHLAGRLVTQAHYLQATRAQLMGLSLAALGLMVVVLLLVFRHLLTAFTPLLVSALAVLWTLGPMGWLHIGIEPLLSLLPALLLVLGSSFSIHLLTRHRTALRAGLRSGEAMAHALRTTRTANLLSAVSTAIGFGTLALYPILPLRVFGLAAAWGLFAALLAARTVVPLMVYRITLPDRMQPILHREPSAAPTFRRGGMVVLAAVLLLLGGALVMPKLRVDNHFLDDLDRSSELGMDATFFEKQFSGTRPLEIAITPTAPDEDLLDPHVLRATDSLLAALQRSFTMSRPLGPPDLARAVLRGTHASGTAPAIAAETRTLRKTLQRQARAKEGPHLLSPDLRHGRIMGRTRDMGSHAFAQQLETLSPWMRNAQITATITGGAFLMDLANRRIATILVQGILAAILLNALLVGAVTRSWRRGIISIVPNVLPLAFAAVMLWLFDLPLKVGTAMIFPVLYGIAMDDTMHFLLHERSSSLRATIRTWRSLRSSLIHTTLVISAGFVLFAFSSFKSIAVFGGITALSLWVALAADLWLLPLITIRHSRRNNAPGADQGIPSCAHQRFTTTPSS